MGQTIWKTLENYRGMWVAVDREGAILGAAGNLEELREKLPKARTYLFACGEDIRS
jgi:hypothetical protein